MFCQRTLLIVKLNQNKKIFHFQHMNICFFSQACALTLWGLWGEWGGDNSRNLRDFHLLTLKWNYLMQGSSVIPSFLLLSGDSFLCFRDTISISMCLACSSAFCRASALSRHPIPLCATVPPERNPERQHSKSGAGHSS